MMMMMAMHNMSLSLFGSSLALDATSDNKKWYEGMQGRGRNTALWQQKPDLPVPNSLITATKINGYEGHFGRGRGRRV